MSATEGNKEGEWRVLAVCGEEGFFLPAGEKLREEGFLLERAGNLYQAIARFARQPVEVVTVELDPLAESELQFISALRELNRDVFVLVAFSQPHRAKAAEALRLGADACLLQPFYPGELVWILRRWAERAERSRSAGDAYQEHLTALARLAKGTAHEINNPLTTLSGWLQMMESEENRPAAERERLASMKEEADRIAEVVERLLAFGQEPPERRAPVDLNAVVAGLLVRAREKVKGVQLKAQLQADEALVWGDEGQLRKGCEILLEDALGALDDGGAIDVRTRVTDGDMLELSVRDNGRRIAAWQLDQIFEPYAVLPRAREAMSLAYPAAYGIFHNHGGELTVTSDEERGTEFMVRLPRLLAAP